MKKPTEIPDYYFADEFFCTMNRSAKSIGYDLERIFKSASFDSVTYKEFYGLIMIMHDDFEEQHQDVQNFFIQNHHRFKPRYFLDKIIMRDFRRRIRRNCE